MLSIVVPPDFDSDATSSDMMVGEGGQVNIFLYFTLFCNFDLQFKKKLLINNILRAVIFLVTIFLLHYRLWNTMIKCSFPIEIN